MTTILKLATYTALALSTVAAAQATPRGAVARPDRKAARDYPHPPLVKLVLDLNSPSATASEVNPGLTAIANLIRRYGSFDGESPQLQIVVVLHAASIDLALDAAASARRNAGAINGSIRLMHDLAAEGVMFVVSQESLAARHIEENDVQDIIHFGPTASIIFLDLEAGGYVFDGSKGLEAD